MEQNSPNKGFSAGKIIGIVAACILIYLGVQNINVVAQGASYLWDVVWPLILGFAFAFILNVPMRFFESHLWRKSEKNILKKIRRPVSYVISLILIIGIMAAVISLIIPELVRAVGVAAKAAMSYVEAFTAMTDEEIAKLPFGETLLSIDWAQLLTSLQSWLKNQSGTIMTGAVDTVVSLVGGIYDLFIAFVFSIYILFAKDRLKAQLCRLVRAWLPETLGEWLIHAAAVANRNFRSFISGQTMEALILGILCTLGMLALDIPYAPMVGALVGVTAFIPVVGAFIGAFVGAFMIMTVAPFKAVVFLAYILILQQIEENLIYPRVMGSHVNLPALWILAAVTVAGGIGGPIDMLLSVPIASTAYELLKEATSKRENKPKNA